MSTWRPAWILFGGCALAFGAAGLNSYFLVRAGTSVAHLTGDLARFAYDLISLDGRQSQSIRVLAGALGSFLMGAMLAGYTIHHPKLELSRPYGRATCGIGLILLLGWWIGNTYESIEICLAAGACGFQNAMATHFRGMVLRTTHITGLLTDLGVTIGMRIRGHNIPAWKILIPLCLLLAFFSGASTGAMLTIICGRNTILYIALSYLTGGAIWIAIKPSLLRRMALERAAAASHQPPSPQ